MEKEEWLRKITEAMNTVAILKTMESRYQLSLLILECNEIFHLSPEKIQKTREDFELNSGIWILAELELQKRKGN